MNRKILYILLVILVLFGCSENSDDRLLGIWISDKDKTLNHLKEQRRLNGKFYAFLNENLGKLKITYTTDNTIIDFDGKISEEKYEILGKDHDSVAIKGKGIFGDDEISIITFDDGYYYTYSELGGYVEYFKKVGE